MSRTRVLSSADVDPRAHLGDGTVVWHLAQIREDASVGDSCIISRGVYVDVGVRVGHRVKIQNYALLYAPATVGDGAFIGPAVVLTNDRYPRSVTDAGAVLGAGDWQTSGVVVGEGASVGAQSVVLAGVHIGPWALVAAGSVVTRDVPAHGLVVGRPARQRGWVGHDGVPLVAEDGDWRSPTSGRRFVEAAEGLVGR